MTARSTVALFDPAMKISPRISSGRIARVRGQAMVARHQHDERLLVTTR